MLNIPNSRSYAFKMVHNINCSIIFLQNDSSHGGNSPEVCLDDEMEKVFSMSGLDNAERFDVHRLHDNPDDINMPRQYNEKDYSRKY